MLRLTDAEKAMLAGSDGPGARRAMEIVCALAGVARAERLVEIESAQVAGVSYRNLGDAGLDLLEGWAAQGARICVPAWMNPCGMDMAAWRALGYPAEFAASQQRVVAALQALGVEPSLTCTPYHAQPPPRRGAHLAWSESSAVAVANSVFGARTNREGGPGALAAAICGRAPFAGLHLDEARRATHRIEVRCPVESPEDFGALGAMVGAAVGDGVPFFVGLAAPEEGRLARLKQVAAAMAATGAVALFHAPGLTAEADDPVVVRDGLPVVDIADLSPGRRRLNRPAGRLDLVALGCPHLSLDELADVAERLRGRRVRLPLWVCLSRAVARQAHGRGLAQAVEASGARLVCDTCMVVAPLEQLGFRSVAVPSAKAAVYLAMHGAEGVRFGTLDECIEAAVTGEWPTPAAAGGVTLRGRAVVSGEAEGELLCSSQPISFYGGVDPATGEVRDPQHDLKGRCVAGKILAFPTGKGSTVGSYTILALRRNGVAPAALLVERADPIVAAGAVIAGLPAIEGLDLSQLTPGRRARVRGDTVTLE